jgi:outer membrane protein assembly factor BamA
VTARRSGAPLRGSLVRRVRRAVAAVLALALTAAPSVLRAQDLTCQAGDREVRSLRFVGNHAFAADQLSNVVVTTPSSAVSRLRIFGTRRCLDPDEFPRDVIRLEGYYRKRGYPQATVDTTVRVVSGSGGRRVDVAFRVTEGAPQRLDRVSVTGLEHVRDASRIVRGFSLHAGDVFDRVALEAFRDTIVQRLHNAGYLHADAFRGFNTADSVTATIEVTPGPFTRIGGVVVRVDTSGRKRQKISDAQVRRTLGIRAGDPYSASDIIAAQRTLYQTDAYRRVEVRVDTVGQPDSLVTIVVGLQEGDLHAARASAGWATLDCFRVQGGLTDRYFMPHAQHLELQARLSQVGAGRPLRFAPDLCPRAKSDPQFSDRVDYYVGATVAQPAFFRLNRVPSLTLFTSRASEFKAFRRETSIGSLVSLASRPGSRLPSTLTYQFEIARTEADEVVFCAIFSACDDVARDRLAHNRPLGALGYTIVRDRTDDPLAPTNGSLQRLTLRHSSALTGSDKTQRFNKVVAEASRYFHLGDQNVLIAHVQFGTLLGRGDAPQQERLYAGGATTVRGYGQNELGPAVYRVTHFDTIPAGGDTVFFRDTSGVGRIDRLIPTGGNSLVVANLELNLRSPVLPRLLQLALFTDAGEVWERRNPSAAFRGLRVTPGAGVRVRSLFGVIRVDAGYNSYARPEGAAYYINATDAGKALYCVSPDNTLAVTNLGSALPVQHSGACPASFQPSTPQGFFRRLNLNIWIGNAF